MAKKPAPGNDTKKKNSDPAREAEELREKVRELEETLDAIRSGEVDAIVVSHGDARQVYTLEGADHPYRALVENIREGALTLSRSGVILYTNSRFADMVKLPPGKVPGTSILDYVCPESQDEIEKALNGITRRSCQVRVRIRQGEKGSLPVHISMNPLDHADDTKISVVVTDRRKDEDRIVMQARMLDAVGDAVVAANLHNKIIYWNDAATRTYGWTSEEAIGRDLVEVATPAISQKEAREIADRLKKGETWTGEYIVKHRDGHEFPIYASDAPIFDDNGKLIAIIGASHDISDQKQAERDLASRNQELSGLNEDLNAAHEELRQTNDELLKANENLRLIEEELLTSNDELKRQQMALTLERDRVKNLLDIAGVMILVLDRKGKVTLINRRGSEILGLPEDQIVGKNWVQNYIPAGIRKEMSAALSRVCAGDLDRFRHIENPVLYRDGSEREILWSNALIRDGDGRVTGVLSSGEDITERKKAEREVQRLLASVRLEKERLSSLVKSIRDEVWFADTKKNFVLANPAALREFAMNDGNANIDIEKLAASLEVYRPDGTPRPVEEAPPLRALKGEVVTGEEMIRTPGRGELRYRQVSAAPVKDAGGHIIGSVSVVRDVTDQKRIEDELKKKHHDLQGAYEEITATQEELRQNVDELTNRERQLNEALAEKEILLSEVHHRVKNNLTAFISLLSLDGTSEDTETGRALKKDLQNRARSMALIHETLYRTGNFSRVDMDVYLTTLVDQVAASYAGKGDIRTTVDAKGVILDLSRATTAGLIVNELITNSFKYAFPPAFDCRSLRCEPAAIRVTINREDESYVITVADNGCGLPPEIDPRASKTLGLKLVNFLARHQLHAEPGVIKDKGTEFNFRIPRSEAAP